MEKLQINTRDKINKRFKLTKLYVDKEIYKEARNVVQNLIRKKGKSILREKTKRKPKKSEKTLENIKTIRSARQKVTNIYLEAKNGLTFDPYTISEVFKSYFLILQAI